MKRISAVSLKEEKRRCSFKAGFKQILNILVSKISHFSVIIEQIFMIPSVKVGMKGVDNLNPIQKVLGHLLQ